MVRSRRIRKLDTNQRTLLELPLASPEEMKFRKPEYPVWTENKARFVAKYMFFFVQVTKHGTYIDGFAGPQQPRNTDMWIAKLVLESDPKWLRSFYLFDSSESQVKRLRQLKRSQPAVPGRNIEIVPGDFNVKVRGLLASGKPKKTEAALCLIDQRTFECNWDTLVALAQYKEPKIELFYFLAVFWFRRALSGVRKPDLLSRWWGRDDWQRLFGMSHERIRDEVVERFKSELGYKYAAAWPIYRRRGGGQIVYYMIHAADHPAAPDLMRRAYEEAVLPTRIATQVPIDFTIKQD